MSTTGTTSPAALPHLPGGWREQAYVEQVMGLPVSIHLRGPDPDGPAARAAVAAAVAELHRADDLFSLWRPGTPVMRLRAGTLRLADADPLVREVHDLCDQARVRTHGWFDAMLPGDDGVRRFDPTGLVKGWAAERAAEHLAALPEHDHLLNAGGDITVGCRRVDTPPWQVGIEDPRDRSRMLRVLPLRTGAVATSGTAARGAHILDPHTGAAVTGLASATVVGPRLMWADVLATAAFAHGPRAEQWLAEQAGHAALLVGHDGSVTVVNPRTPRPERVDPRR